MSILKSRKRKFGRKEKGARIILGSAGTLGKESGKRNLNTKALLAGAAHTQRKFVRQGRSIENVTSTGFRTRTQELELKILPS